ncbi:MAG: 2-hydroxychromene-2-carboxylate isomerase [Burkholderiales bacterium]|nr:MAG: 2-hydroxychromene-2-carboxylate isomerase [Burkholderiales bacterium]
MDWYFDFVSPYAYLQSEIIERVLAHAEVRPRPVLYAGLLAHFAHKGPAEIVPKRRHTYRQVLWLAQRHGIALRFPAAHPFNPLPLLRLAVALGADHALVHTLFRFVWAEGHLPTEPAPWEALNRSLGVDDPDAIIAEPGAKEQLRANTREAIERGVFGVPTLAIDDELYWGFDATEMALAHLAGDAFFGSSEIERVGSLPEGVQRKRD